MSAKEVHELTEFLTGKKIKLLNKGTSAKGGIKRIIALVTTPGLIELKPSDLLSLFKRSKALSIISAAAKGKNAAGLVAKKLSATVKKGEIAHNRKLAFNVTGNKAMTLFNVNEIAESIYTSSHPKADIIFGATIEKKLKGIEVVVVAG